MGIKSQANSSYEQPRTRELICVFDFLLSDAPISRHAFAPFLKVIKQRSNCVVNITTSGAPTMTIEERLRPAATFKPEVASLNMGSMNFGLFPMLELFREFNHPWERPYLEGSKDRIFRNTFADIEYILTTCAGNGTRFEIECYDIGHLYTLAHFVDRGLVKPPGEDGPWTRSVYRRGSGPERSSQARPLPAVKPLGQVLGQALDLDRGQAPRPGPSISIGKAPRPDEGPRPGSRTSIG